MARVRYMRTKNFLPNCLNFDFLESLQNTFSLALRRPSRVAELLFALPGALCFSPTDIYHGSLPSPFCIARCSPTLVRHSIGSAQHQNWPLQ
jgi:hypothetical protein